MRLTDMRLTDGYFGLSWSVRLNSKRRQDIQQTDIGRIRFFVIATFLLFLVLFLITGAAVFGGAPEVVQIVMKNVCAWSSTFVLVFFFKRFYPGRKFLDFFKAQFTPVRVSDFLFPSLIQLGLAAGAIAAVMAVSGESLKTVEVVSLSGLFPLLLINITSGPTGEELGWRAYAQQELQKRLSPLAASLWIGLLWGLWHLPLWLVSGYTGLDLLLYSLFFLLGIVSFSVFLTYFYNKSGNILVAVWIHFVFNILLQIFDLDSLKIIIAVSVLYLVATSLIVLSNNKEVTRPILPRQAARRGAACSRTTRRRASERRDPPAEHSTHD